MSGRRFPIALSFAAALILAAGAGTTAEDKGAPTPTSKVFTQDDLERYHPQPARPTPTSADGKARPAPTVPPSATATDTPEPRGSSAREIWHERASTAYERLDHARSAVAATEAAIQAAKSRMNVLTYPIQPPTKEVEELEEQLVANKAAVVECQKQLDAVLDEARQNNIPPGWIER
jgi:hypothetical protein